MEHSLYSEMALICCVVLLLLYIRTCRLTGRGKQNRELLVLLVFSLFFCLEDTLWGFGLSNIPGFGREVFAFLSYGYFLMSSVSTYLWDRYALACYKADGNCVTGALRAIPIVSLVVELFMLTANAFNHKVFVIGENNEYLVGPLRHLIFLLQILNYLLILVLFIVSFFRHGEADKNDTESRIVVSTIPLIGCILAMLFCDSPMYSCGFMVTCIGIHIFFVTQGLIEKNKLLMEAVGEAERANSAKTDFLARMSHDIRTPINGIMGMTEIAEKKVEDKEKVLDCLHKIDISSGHLLSLVNDILDMNKLESGKIEFRYEAVDIRALLEDVRTMIMMQAKNGGIAVRPITFDNLRYPYVICSPTHVRQILINLASNAIKFNKPGGSVWLEVEESNYSGEAVMYRFTIGDTGIGMTREFMKKLYDPFSQEINTARTKYKGTGLGTAIVKRLVEQMDGMIECESEPGEGTVFTVELPFQVAKEYHEEDGNEAVKSDILKGMRILLAEDNEINIEVAEFMLSDAGANVTTVTDGSQAVELMKQATSDCKFDLILMDVMMPVMDGMEATRKIRALENENARNIPIIAMTANAFADDIIKCLEAGMNEHVSKPLSLSKLTETLGKFF